MLLFHSTIYVYSCILEQFTSLPQTGEYQVIQIVEKGKKFAHLPVEI